MNRRLVRIISPANALPSEQSIISIATYIIPITNSYFTIYDTVDSLTNKKLIPVKIENIRYLNTEFFPLEDVMNIHDSTGIKDLSQLKSMITDIQMDKDIVSVNGIPNIKLVKTDADEWLLFDGHHSMLAYMYVGKKYLHEIPYLTVENENTKYVSSDEISVFFGPHADKIKNKNWRDYTINWQAPIDQQLCPRIQKNMGELYDILASKISSLFDCCEK